MDLTALTTSASTSHSSRFRLVGALVLSGFCLALLPSGLGSGSSSDIRADEQLELGFTNWYLRINEYLFEGRDRKKFIAALPSSLNREATA